MAKEIQLKDGSGKVYPHPFWPVGAIYISVINENPSKYFGGTWVSFGAGKCIVGVDTSQSEFNTVQKTGGSKTVALTTAQMPAHNHGSKSLKGTLEYVHAPYPLINASGIVSKSQLSQLDNYTGTNANARNRGQWNIDASHTHNTEGAGQAHDNLQPYITVYMWRRTA